VNLIQIGLDETFSTFSSSLVIFIFHLSLCSYDFFMNQVIAIENYFLLSSILNFPHYLKYLNFVIDALLISTF